MPRPENKTPLTPEQADFAAANLPLAVHCLRGRRHPDRDEAESDALWALVQCARHYDAGKGTLPQVLTVAVGRRLKMSRERHERFVRVVPDAFVRRHVRRPDDVVASLDAARKAVRLLQTLPFTLRQAVQKVILEGNRCKDVGVELGMTGEAVRQNVQRGLAKLRTLWGDDDFF